MSRVRRRAVATIVLVTVAPAIWLTHLLVSYALVPVSCRIGSDAPMHVVTALAVAGVIAAVVVAVRAAPTAGRTGRVLVSSTMPRAVDGRPALLLVSAALAVYFAVVVIMTGLVPVVVDRCA